MSSINDLYSQLKQLAVIDQHQQPTATHLFVFVFVVFVVVAVV